MIIYFNEILYETPIEISLGKLCVVLLAKANLTLPFLFLTNKDKQTPYQFS
jgi:hypothetical protein